MFNYEINMKKEKSITIIIAPNGYGKTTLLNLLDWAFHKKFLDIGNTPFTNFKINFDDKSNIEFVKKYEDTKNLRRLRKFDIIYHDSDNKKCSSAILEPSKKIKSIYESLFDEPYRENLFQEYLSMKNLLSRSYDLSAKEQKELLRQRYLLLNFLRHRPEFFRESLVKEAEIDKKIIEVLNSIPVHFIQSQRLLNIDPDLEERNMVTIYSNELKKDIQSKLAEYGAIAQKLERNFPSRLVKRLSKRSENKVPTQDEISGLLAELEQKRQRLIAVGLLDSEERFVQPSKAELIKPDTRQVLTLYSEDAEEKLAVLNEFAEKLHLLKEIINTRFQHKQMIISRENGFLFGLPNREISIEPKQLSSGEQHTLVLNYQLLFKAQPGSLILIDEPEISLHVHWQHQFLDDLQKISNIVNLNILIATHSPSIIHDRWELTVELGGSLK